MLRSSCSSGNEKNEEAVSSHSLYSYITYSFSTRLTTSSVSCNEGEDGWENKERLCIVVHVVMQNALFYWAIVVSRHCHASNGSRFPSLRGCKKAPQMPRHSVIQGSHL